MSAPRLVLRTCRADMTSYGGFVWPESGPVEAPDWDPDPDRDCGGGLHGLLGGQGNASLLDWSSDARWLVVEVTGELIERHGKCRFSAGVVTYCGDRPGALRTLRAAGVTLPLPGDTVVAGDLGVATVGHRGTATAGDIGVATVGHRGTATAGDFGVATAGNGGIATAGNGGIATAGNYGTAAAGHCGTATAGDGGTATAGDGGTLCLRWYDAVAGRWRLAVGYVGENGIRPNTPYRATSYGQFVEADK